MFHRHRPAEAFRLIREAGFRFVELGGAHFPAAEATLQSVAELQRQLADAGLTPIAAFIVHPLASSDDQHFFVAQISNLLYRRFPIGQAFDSKEAVVVGTGPCRLETCGTADWKSALRLGPSSAAHPTAFSVTAQTVSTNLKMNPTP
jgi:sugar phosphate isomerase/epimerase